MATDFKLNALLSLPEDFSETLEVGKTYQIQKNDARIMPFNIPMELSTHNHKYLAKVVVKELLINEIGTRVKFEVLKIFSEEESRVYTENFVPGK
jgi:hypothetical protein